MNIHDIFLGEIANFDYENEFGYAFNIYCLFDETIDVPRHIRETYSGQEQIMFKVSSDLNHSMRYDYENRILSFDATFGGIFYRVKIPADKILGIVDILDGTYLHFGKSSVESSNVNKQPAEKKKKKPNLRVV